MEKILEEAKKLYVPGTEYRCSAGGPKYTVNQQSFSIYSQGVIYGELGKGCLYYYGKWAEIISVPSQEYEIF